MYVSGFLLDENPKIFLQNIRESFTAKKNYPQYTKFRTIVSGYYFLEKILTNKANANVKSADFQTFIENIVLGRYDDAINLLLDKNGVFVKSYSSLNEKCEGVSYWKNVF